jgi:hypothetical protein
VAAALSGAFIGLMPLPAAAQSIFASPRKLTVSLFLAAIAVKV